MFIQIIQGRCSREAEMREAIERWRRECEPGAEGWLGGTYGFTDDGQFVGVVRFTSEDDARRNSDRPEQASWWQQTEQLFDGPVEFHDCREVSVMLGGGSDDAGFVQIIRGKVDDPIRLRELMESSSQTLHAARPEILGATLAIEDDGTFTEMVAFTDEATARAHESDDRPDDMQLQMAEVRTRDLQYIDLHRPWFASHGQSTTGE